MQIPGQSKHQNLAQNGTSCQSSCHRHIFGQSGCPQQNIQRRLPPLSLPILHRRWSRHDPQRSHTRLHRHLRLLSERTTQQHEYTRRVWLPCAGPRQLLTNTRNPCFLHVWHMQRQRHDHHTRRQQNTGVPGRKCSILENGSQQPRRVSGCEHMPIPTQSPGGDALHRSQSKPAVPCHLCSTRLCRVLPRTTNLHLQRLRMPTRGNLYPKH